MIAFTWIASIVGVLGIGGTIVAAILFPTVAIPLIQTIVGRIIACKPCLYVLILLGACWGSWWFGHHQEVLACRAEELAAELRNQEFDLAVAQQAKADAEKRAQQIEDSSNERAKKDGDYIKSLESKPACLLDDNDVDGVPNHKSRSRWPKLTPRSK